MHRLISLLSIVILAVFCSVWQNVQIVKTGRSITQKEKILQDLRFKTRMLEIRIANLKSLERIESISKKDLGLCKAKEYRVVYLKDKKLENRLAKANDMVSGLLPCFGTDTFWLVSCLPPYKTIFSNC